MAVMRPLPVEVSWNPKRWGIRFSSARTQFPFKRIADSFTFVLTSNRISLQAPAVHRPAVPTRLMTRRRRRKQVRAIASPRQFFFLGADRDRATVAISLRCAVLVARKTRVPVCLAAVAIFLPLAKRNTSSFNRSFLVFPQRARRRPSEQLAVRRSQWQEKSPFRRNLARKTLKWQSSTRWGAVADQRLVAVIKRPFSYLSFYLLQG